MEVPTSGSDEGDGFVVLFERRHESSMRFHRSAHPLHGALVLRCPSLPANLGDRQRRFGITVGRRRRDSGFTLYFALSGVAIGRIESHGAATALPDTSDVTAAVATLLHTAHRCRRRSPPCLRLRGAGCHRPAAAARMRPAEKTTDGTADTFRLFAQGIANEAVHVELAQVRLGSDLVLANYPPVADAGPDRVAPIGSAVRFDGRASYDVEGAALKYKWRCIDAPYVSASARRPVRPQPRMTAMTTA